MKRLISLAFASCTFIVPALANLPVETSAFATSPAPVEVVELGAMRAGWTAPLAHLGSSEREELRAASELAPDLGAMRAGDGPTDNQWKWIGIGAAVVLLIVLL